MAPISSWRLPPGLFLSPWPSLRCSPGLARRWARHGACSAYWVLFKLAITVFITIVVLMYMETFRVMAGAAADPLLALASVRNPSPVIHVTLALFVLLVATVLGVYKPHGMTRYGWRKHHEDGTPPSHKAASI